MRTGILAADDAVSPLVGVVLLVAIVVAFAAVLATFGLGFSDRVSDDPPDPVFAWTFENNSAVRVVHDAGAELDDPRLQIRVGGRLAYDGTGATGNVRSPFDGPYAADGWDDRVTPGDAVRLHGSGNYSGRTVRVVWNESSGTQTATVGKRQWP